MAILALLLVLGAARAQDADTIKLEDKTFRLDGIDAPEIDQNCLDAGGVLYPCGRVAAQELANLIGTRPAHCEDRGGDTAHKQRRIGLCHAADGTEINRWLVQQGWAINFEPYAKGRFKTDEDDARADQRGMWKGCFVAPRDFRRWNKKTAVLLGPNCPADARDKLFPDDPLMPPGCEIKGKYSLRAWPYRGIYHEPGCGSYRRTKTHERWFCSEEDAWAADFRRSFTCWLKTSSPIEDTAKFASFGTRFSSYLVGLNEDFKPAAPDFARAQRFLPFGNAVPVQQLLNTGRQHVGTVFDWPTE